MKIKVDADYYAGYVVIAVIFAVAVAVLSWFAWHDIGQWQHPRTWFILGALLLTGPAWVLAQFRRGKQED